MSFGETKALMVAGLQFILCWVCWSIRWGMWGRAAFNSQGWTVLFVLNPCPAASSAWFLWFLLGIACGAFYVELTHSNGVLKMAKYRIQWSLQSEWFGLVLNPLQCGSGFPPFSPPFFFPWGILFCSLADWSPLSGRWNTLCLGKASRYSSSCGRRDLWGQGRSWHLDVSIFFPTFREKLGINSTISAAQ